MFIWGSSWKEKLFEIQKLSSIVAKRKVRSTLLAPLRAHRDTLQNFIVTISRDISLETLSTGMGRVLGNCLQILQDAVSVLNSLIEYLERTAP